MSGYNAMIEKDLEFMWSMQDWFKRSPWLDAVMFKIVSKYPLQDIGMVVWCFFLVGVIEIGRQHFWIVSMNLILAVVARNLIEAKRPVEFDRRLQPTTDINSGSYGLPSLESYMAVVVLGHVTIASRSLLMFPIAVLIIFTVGLSRIYSKSRFPHQIFASWIMGGLGLFFFIHFIKFLEFHRMSNEGHGICVFILALIVLGNISLAIENNESRIISIPKREFTKVIRGIISASTDSANQGPGSGTGTADPSGDSLAETQSSLTYVQRGQRRGRDENLTEMARGRKQSNQPIRALNNAAMRGRPNRKDVTKRSTSDDEISEDDLFDGKNVKKDSFFFLQRSMEVREESVRSSLKHARDVDAGMGGGGGGGDRNTVNNVRFIRSSGYRENEKTKNY